MIVERISEILDRAGAAWILYLLIGLSVLSVAIVIERLIFLARNRVPVARLRGPLLAALDRGRDEAAALLGQFSGMEAQVALAGVREIDRGADAVEEVMAAAEAAEQGRYKRFLGALGSIGSNAPFVGLLGTVIGIMGAFGDLRARVAGSAADGAQAAIMGSIAEALVATAIGLVVAIPAVVAYNQLRGRLDQAQNDTRVLSGLLLAFARQRPAAARPHLDHDATIPGDSQRRAA